MSGTSSLFRKQSAAGDPASDLVSSSDDFSVKISSRLDKRFWVRLEREADNGVLVVTDFNPGDRPVEELVAGLTMAVRSMSRGDVQALSFRDLVPAGDQAPNFPARVVHAVDLVKDLGAAVAGDLATSVAGFEMHPRRGKIDALVTFARVS